MTPGQPPSAQPARPSPASHSSPADGFIPRHGGYRHTRTWQLADLIYDVTVRFCDRFVDRRSRTHDQMVRAARSGCQNLQNGGFTERLYCRRKAPATAPAGLTDNLTDT
jgi:hypothetical protein